jgi:hypothetical protein
MLTGKYRRIYHHHLKKCGGTTLNHWLDTLTFDERTSDRFLWGLPIYDRKFDDTPDLVIPQFARTLFYWSDVLHSHGPLRLYAPDNTFCFTMLRDPVQRLLSQIADWRQLGDADAIESSAEVRECIADSRRLALRDFLEKHGHPDGRRGLDNYMTRALAAGRIGHPFDDATDPDRLREAALHSLEQDYDVIGLTEHMDLSRNVLCAMVGLPPARKIPTLNVTGLAGRTEPDVYGACDILTSLTRVDCAIYDRARQLFDRRHRHLAESYDAEAFETHHASRLLGETRGFAFDGATRYSVRSPIVGSGYHGRDGSGMPSCAVWSGPETRTTLYIPTPPDMPLSLLVWIRGYVESGQRDQVRVRVDGRPASHHFAWANDYADVLTVDTNSTRDFVRLEIDVDETLESGEPGSELHDARKRGFAFDSYGWRPL